MQSAALLPDVHWPRRLARRVGTFWPIKMVANIVGIAAFFVVYFQVLHLPHPDVTVMPVTALDRWISFEPLAFPLYASLWLYISLPLALLRTPRELVSYGLAAFALSALAMTAFVLWPTTVPRFADVDASAHAAIGWLKSLDAGSNACPSLHVAFAVFSAAWLERLLREMAGGTALRALNVVWCLGILYSTLATRQHVLLDVLAGAALGAAVVALHLRLLDGGASRTGAPR